MKPILFSTEMVQAILAGRKTQTRRVMGVSGALYPNETVADWVVRWKVEPRYHKGDILWVRETWQTVPSEDGEGYAYVYRASQNGRDWEDNTEGWKWRPSIFMPKEAARLILKVTNVRAERLQDISEEDARAEGVGDPYEYQHPMYYDYKMFDGVSCGICAFAGLWESINAKRGYGWETNPFVFVYEFERVEVEGWKG
jgi:hypothetical protein